MLVLRRKAGESIIIAGTITVFVLAVEGERIKIGIDAPSDVTIVRAELLQHEQWKREAGFGPNMEKDIPQCQN